MILHLEETGAEKNQPVLACSASLMGTEGTAQLQHPEIVRSHDLYVYIKTQGNQSDNFTSVIYSTLCEIGEQ